MSLTRILMITVAMTVCAATSYATENVTPDTEVIVRATKRVKPTDAPPQLELYAKAPRFEQIALSPDGSRLAFTTHLGDVKLLVGYKFSDHQHIYYKLDGDDISALHWADDTHVLISNSRLVARGTCGFNAGTTLNPSRDSRSVLTKPEATGAADQSNQNQIQLLLDMNRSPRCSYFGIRSENAITSVNMLTGKGTPIGAHIGDAPSLALGFPSRIITEEQSSLIGPFLEMRTQSSGSQPMQRVFLWKINPETGHGQLVDDGGGDIERENRYVDDWLFDRNGNIVARSLYDFLHDTYRIEIKSGSKWKPVLSRDIIKAEHTFAPSLVGLTDNGKSIVVLDTATHGVDPKDAIRQFHYYKLDLNGAFSGPLEEGDAGQVRPIFDPSSGFWAGFASQSDEAKYDIREPRLNAVYSRALEAAPGQVVEVLSVSDDLKKVLIRVVGDEDTGSYYLLDFTKGSSTILGEDFPQIPTNWIARQDSFSYAARDGTSLNGVLTLPPKPTQKLLPIIVLPHDGPIGQDSIGFNWLSQALASRGYLVFQPNYRGSVGNGNDFVSAGYGQWDGKILSDITDGVDALVRQGIADPKRVCMVGIGFGGYVALKDAEKGISRCAVSIDGISDAGRYLDWRKSNASSPNPDAFASLAPSPKWPRTFLNDPNSPRNIALFIGSSTPSISASTVSSPVLLIHQDGDRVVPVTQSRRLRDQLQAAGKQVEYLELIGDAHTPESDEQRLKVLQSVLEFLSVHNPTEN